MNKLAALVALCAPWLGCLPPSNTTSTPVSAPASTPPTTRAQPLGPPRWFMETAKRWVESTDAGIHRGVFGVRVETQGRRIVGIADKPATLSDARAAPPWTTPANVQCRYVFWDDDKVFAAAEWLGEARQIATLPMPVQYSFDWFDGVGLTTANGMFVVRTSACTVDKLDVPNAALVHASSADHALVLTALGHARMTLDGAKSYRDVTAELPNAGAIERKGSDLHVSTGTDELFVVNAKGIIKPSKPLEERDPDELPPDPEDRWPAEHDSTTPLQAAVNNGLLLPNGDAIAADKGLVARINLETGRATEILRFGTDEESCMPVTVSDRALVVCETERRASVIDAGSGHVERTFDLEQEFVWDRFVAVDGEALGFVGPCSGRNPAPPVDVVTSASATNTSTQRSQSFCARTASGTWVEHQVEAADATDIVAWIPRSDGSAVALVALQGTFLHETPRVETRGSLRIVRVARNAPPLNVSTYMSETPKQVSRALRALPDGAIEGWLTSGHSSTGVMAITIDGAGRARQNPLPARTSTMMTAGRFALAHTEDNRYFESTDFGRTFQPIDPPPGTPSDPVTLSAIGSQLGSFIRIGWGPHSKAKPPEPSASEPFSMQPRRMAPVFRLGCRFSGPPVSMRVSDTFGLGATKSPTPQMSTGRIPLAGAFYMPWRGVATTLAGNAELTFVPLLDLAAPLKRASIPLSRIENPERMTHEIRLAFVLDGATAWPVAAERFGRCLAPLVDDAGLTVPMGGMCLDDPTVGVAVDGKAFLVHADTGYIFRGHTKIAISTADIVTDRSKQTKLRATNLKSIATHHVSGGVYNFKFAAGVRGKKPVLVAIDAAGNATLAPIDPTRGTLGPEEPLVSLSKLQIGNDARCAESPDDARILFPFTTEIGLQTKGLPGIRDTEHGGLAIIRWSNRRACLDAIDIAVQDERHEADMMMHVSQGPIRKVVTRFDKSNQGKGTLVVMTFGTEVRQPVVCEGAAP